MRVLAAILLPALLSMYCSEGDVPADRAAGGGTTETPRTGPAGREIQEGVREYQDGNYPEAVIWFRRAVESRPEDPQSHYYLGYALLQEDQNRAALEALERAVSLHGDFLPARLARARVFIRLGDYSLAEKEFRHVLGREPENIVALFNLGFILSRTGGYPEAVEVLEKVTRLRPDHPDASYYLGLAAMKSGDPARARTAFEQAIRLDPDHPGARFNFGQLLMRLGEKQAAEEQLQIFKKLSDEVTAAEHLQEQIHYRSVEAYQLRGDGDLNGAIRITREILEIAPDNAPAWKDLAILQLANGLQEEGLNALLRATEIDPNYGPAYFHLSRVYREMGDSRKAAEAADRFQMLESGEGARRQEGRRW